MGCRNDDAFLQGRGVFSRSDLLSDRLEMDRPANPRSYQDRKDILERKCLVQGASSYRSFPQPANAAKTSNHAPPNIGFSISLRVGIWPLRFEAARVVTIDRMSSFGPIAPKRHAASPKFFLWLRV